MKSFQDWLNRRPRGPAPKKPLPRSTKRIPKVGKKRRKERSTYAEVRKDYLARHPFCQLTIARLRFEEARVLAALEESRRTGLSDRPWGLNVERQSTFWFLGEQIPWADQIHHRNKCQGARLTDERWLSSACHWMHEWVESHKRQARDEGYLLPLEADADGRLPNGSQCLITEEWIRVRASEKI